MVLGSRLCIAGGMIEGVAENVRLPLSVSAATWGIIAMTPPDRCNAEQDHPDAKHDHPNRPWYAKGRHGGGN